MKQPQAAISYKQMNEQSLCDFFMDTESVQVGMFELTIPRSNTIEYESPCELTINAVFLCEGDKDVYMYIGVVGVNSMTHANLDVLEHAQNCVGIASDAHGFREPLSGLNMFADSVDGEITKVRWVITKCLDDSSLEYEDDIYSFLSGQEDRTNVGLLMFEYGALTSHVVAPADHSALV